MRNNFLAIVFNSSNNLRFVSKRIIFISKIKKGCFPLSLNKVLFAEDSRIIRGLSKKCNE
jgi:hypothetical protein